MERTVEFRRCVGMDRVELWSAPDIARATIGEEKERGSHALMYLKLITSLHCLYLVLFLATLGFATGHALPALNNCLKP
jgi:hypothetical protein